MKALRRTGLARALSKLGHCSRSAAFPLIRNGQVRVNKRVCRDPEKPVQIGRDQIEVGGRLIAAVPGIYMVLNKPRGVVTTAADEKGRKTIYDFLDPSLPWLAPAGRLDMASEGLLLITNDSEWAAKISDPARHVDKVYHVQVKGQVRELSLASILQGIPCENDLLRAKQARILRQGEKTFWLEIVLDEGKNRHIRRMLAKLGFEVLRLLRIGIGPIQLGDLPKGSVRALSRNEKSTLDGMIDRTGRE